ncbi:MAG: outer membrane lipoprotein carrier protein LolA [Myxococcaceae bacterium]|nr:outer membrane lipoprotein carrier protein LolA [Myxococcaceae bacterium]
MMIFLLLPVFAAADAGTPAMNAETGALVDRLQAFYEKANDFTADFKQDYTYKAFKRTLTSTGKVIYLRAEKGPQMRWDYEKPDPKSFVLAQDKVRFYDPAAQQLSIMPMSTDKLSASVSFLWGQGKLAAEFSIVKKDCAKCTGVLLELTPLRPDPRFKQVRLEVDPKTAQVLKSTVVDPDGSENAITFSNLKMNPGVKGDAFVITTPKGTVINDMTKAAGGAPAPAPAPRDGGV